MRILPTYILNYLISLHPLGIHLVAGEGLACLPAERVYLLTGRCNHAGQVFTEEEQGLTTLPSSWGIELQPMSPLRVVKGD